MPGPGLVDERPYGTAETPRPEDMAALGATTVDVYVNEHLLWNNVPTEVWDFTIGRFQVLKKWLSYRAYAVIDRPLTLEEVNDFRDTARRLAALRLMGDELDQNHQACAEASWPWRVTAAATGP